MALNMISFLMWDFSRQFFLSFGQFSSDDKWFHWRKNINLTLKSSSSRFYQLINSISYFMIFQQSPVNVRGYDWKRVISEYFRSQIRKTEKKLIWLRSCRSIVSSRAENLEFLASFWLPIWRGFICGINYFIWTDHTSRTHAL